MIYVGWSHYSTAETLLDTELNSLADGDLVLSDEIDNSKYNCFYIDLFLHLGSVDMSSSTNPSVDVWLISSIDGTLFEDGSSSVTPARAKDGCFQCRLGSGAMEQNLMLREVSLPPGKFKVLLKNNTGVTLASSGNYLKYSYFRESIYYV